MGVKGVRQGMRNESLKKSGIARKKSKFCHDIDPEDSITRGRKKKKDCKLPDQDYLLVLTLILYALMRVKIKQ